MSGEKKLWRTTPFWRAPEKQGPPLNANLKASRSGSRVSSVYLSDDSSTNGFVIVPEFDDPVRAKAALQESNHTPHLLDLPAVTSPDHLLPHGADNHLDDIESTGSQYSPDLGDSSDASSIRDDDLTQRLRSAYEYIHSMPSAASSKVLLSSDPQVLRKQLGVPQHSVFNHPNHSSLDLPNPHPSPCQRTSPPPPFVTSPDISHAKISNNFNLHANTDVYPTSPCRGFPDHQLAQKESMATAPTPSQNSLSECSALGEPGRAHIAHLSKPQVSAPRSSKLAKWRIEKPTVSASSLPTPRLHALRSVSHKSVAGTSPSNNAPLPQVRPLSPFAVDIPLHHTWHDRATDFSIHGLHPQNDHVHEKEPRRISGSADALASLAWIGTSPIAMGPHTANWGSQPASPAFFSDRLSMAIAVDDDKISDDDLMDQLEKVRRTGNPSERCRDVLPSRFSDDAHPRSVGEGKGEHFYKSCPSTPPQIPERLVDSCMTPLPSPPVPADTTSNSDDTAIWQTARKALFCIREIVQTEKKYQGALKMLLNAQTSTPPPSSMIPYVRALVRASEMLLKRFLEDPSAWGVSTAFVTSEDELETTMVAWSSVAGGFFTNENDFQPSGGKRHPRKSGIMSSSSLSVMKQASNPFAPRLSPIFSMTASGTKERMDEDHRAGQHLQTEQERKTIFGSLQKPGSMNRSTLSGQPPSRKLSVRDLAIQPIQRVMRYVLLYRDLLDRTPLTSPSRLLVERALEAATRIADHCDRAQRNPAFFRVS